MIEERATVIGIEPHLVWLETVRSSACGSCAARAGCGQPLMSKVLGGKAQQQRNRLPVLMEQGSHRLRAGDHVLLGIPETSIIMGAFWLYLAPILALLLGAIVGQQLTGSDWGAFGLGGCLFVLCLLFVRQKNRRWQHEDRWRPRILDSLANTPAARPGDPDVIAVKVL